MEKKRGNRRRMAYGSKLRNISQGYDATASTHAYIGQLCVPRNTEKTMWVMSLLQGCV